MKHLLLFCKGPQDARTKCIFYTVGSNGSDTGGKGRARQTKIGREQAQSHTRDQTRNRKHNIKIKYRHDTFILPYLVIILWMISSYLLKKKIINVFYFEN